MSHSSRVQSGGHPIIPPAARQTGRAPFRKKGAGVLSINPSINGYLVIVMVQTLFRCFLFLTAKPLRRCAVYLSYGAGVLISALPVFWSQSGPFTQHAWWPAFLPGDLTSCTWLLMAIGLTGITFEVREQHRLRRENQRLRAQRADAARIEQEQNTRARRRRRFITRFLEHRLRALTVALGRGDQGRIHYRTTLYEPCFSDGAPTAFEPMFCDSSNPVYRRQATLSPNEPPKTLLLLAWQHGWHCDNDIPSADSDAYRRVLQQRYRIRAERPGRMQPRLYACLRIQDPVSRQCVALLLLESTHPPRCSRLKLRQQLEETARSIAWLPALRRMEQAPQP